LKTIVERSRRDLRRAFVEAAERVPYGLSGYLDWREFVKDWKDAFALKLAFRVDKRALFLEDEIDDGRVEVVVPVGGLFVEFFRTINI
jgi:hypothetical protein